MVEAYKFADYIPVGDGDWENPQSEMDEMTDEQLNSNMLHNVQRAAETAYIATEGRIDEAITQNVRNR